MIRKCGLFFVMLFLSIVVVKAQPYQGPKQGSLTSGVIQTTDAFAKASDLIEPKELKIGNEETLTYDTPEYIKFDKPAPPEGSNYFKDLHTPDKALASSGPPILFKSFNGINMTNYIPPDPNLAVGPTHIIATVNTTMNIWDKSGNLVKSINGGSWVAQIAPAFGQIADPKIAYDHFDKRWVVVWLTLNTTTHTSYWTISVSKDSTPLGTWYSWATPCTLNGPDSTDNFGDYEGLGFDKDCIYITGNQYNLTSSTFAYSKLRIIPKPQLYTNTAGPITWWDLWDIKVPFGSSSTRTIRPSYIYGAPNEYYLIYANGGGSNSLSLFKLTNPVSAPVLTGVNVPVTTYVGAPNANQLGGGTLLIEAGASSIVNEAKYRDGFLWVVHSVSNPINGLYSAIHYVKIDVKADTCVEDLVFGDVGLWHFYPAIIVDKDDNMAVTYSRSGDNEYIGSYYASRLKSDPLGLSGGYLLQKGNGNYVVDYGSKRNRWGDYSGFCLDPSDQNNLWMMSEFAVRNNNWGTYIGGIRLVPFNGVKLFTYTPSINMGNVELSNSSDTLSSVIKNFGSQNLIISAVTNQIGPFHLTDNLTFPITLTSYDSLVLHFKFIPVQTGVFQENIVVSCNDPSFTGISLSGRGYKINTAAVNTLYASSGIGNSGNILTINPQTGAGTNLGISLYNEIRGLAVNPKTKITYGISTNTDSTGFVRINALAGDSYNLFTIPVGNMTSIAFDTTGSLYAAMRNGLIYKVNLETKFLSQICSTSVKLMSIAFNPKTNDLYGSPYIPVGTNKDAIFKINLSTGDTSFIGKTGFTVLTNGITFDDKDNLYGVYGPLGSANNLISIDKSTGKGTLVGSVGINNITGLSFSSSMVTSIGPNKNLPLSFNLMQNYPNPFNPSTSIEYSVPKASNVKITVYNILGEIVEVLANTFREAGNYKISWNAGKITSGVYFYELKAVASSGEEFSQLKKMILLK